MKITFITGNANKAEQVARWLGHPIQHHKLDLDELQSLDAREVVEHKVRQAYGKVEGAVLVEDGSLELDALGGAPGPLVKWFQPSTDMLCRMLDGFETRTATARLYYALFDGQQAHFFEGTMRGRIADRPAGKGGFGWDNVFINKGFDTTRAQMNEADYAATSYRKQALDKLAVFLNK
jgi:XTP/dITP diphosphohydrolase